jgi:hypothetical protein
MHKNNKASAARTNVENSSRLMPLAWRLPRFRVMRITAGLLRGPYRRLLNKEHLRSAGQRLFNFMGPFEMTKFNWFPNALKSCVSLLIAVVAALMAWTALQKQELSYVYGGIAGVLLVLACAPWALPWFRLLANRSTRRVSDRNKRHDSSARAVVTKTAEPALRNNEAKELQKKIAEQRLASLHNVVKKKNSGPPGIKTRYIDRPSAAQWRIKRYTRAK